MSTEYVKLTPDERLYGGKAFLESQISLLTIIKRYKNFQRLRKEELDLKLQMKKATDELKQQLQILDQILPKTRFHEEKAKEEKLIKEMTRVAEIETRPQRREDLSLEQEIADIQRRLQRLQ